MKQQTYMLNTLLAAAVGLVLLVGVLVRTFIPILILPQPEIPNLVLVSLAALLADHYLAPGAKRCWVCIPVLAVLTFGLLPYAACFVNLLQAGKLAVLGGVTFTVTAWLFTSIQDHLSSGPACKAAPAVSALGLYLASQGFVGLFA